MFFASKTLAWSFSPLDQFDSVSFLNSIRLIEAPNLSYASDIKKVISLEILALTVKSLTRKSYIRNGKTLLSNSLMIRRGSSFSPLSMQMKPAKNLQVRSYMKEITFLFNCWYLDVEKDSFWKRGAYVRAYQNLQFKRLDTLEGGQFFSTHWIEMRKMSPQMRINSKLKELPHYKEETERFLKNIKAKNMELEECKQKLDNLYQDCSFIDKINSKFQKHLDNAEPSADERLQKVTEETLGLVKGIHVEVTSDDQVAILEAMRKLDFDLFQSRMELLVNTYVKSDLEYDLALKYHKFLKSLQQQYELDAHLGPQGTLQDLIDADNSFVEVQKLLKLKPKMKWKDFNQSLRDSLSLETSSENSIMKETGPQSFVYEPDIESSEDLPFVAPVEDALRRGGPLDTGAGTGLRLFSYLENISVYDILCSDCIYLFSSYWGVFYSIGYVILFWPKISLFIDYQGIKLWCKNLAWNLLISKIHFFKSLVSTFLFEYSFFIPRIWVLISHLIKKTAQTDW